MERQTPGIFRVLDQRSHLLFEKRRRRSWRLEIVQDFSQDLRTFQRKTIGLTSLAWRLLHDVWPATNQPDPKSPRSGAAQRSGEQECGPISPHLQSRLDSWPLSLAGPFLQ